MMSYTLGWRSLFGGGGEVFFMKSSRYLTYVRNRNLLPWHQDQATKSRLVLLNFDKKFRLSINQTGWNNMSFTYPIAKRVDVVENLHGIAVKQQRQIHLVK